MKYSYFVKLHASFMGQSGYNNHTRELFTHLNRLIDVRLRNFSMDGSNLYNGNDGAKWATIDENGHVIIDWTKKDEYLDDSVKNMIVEQSLFHHGKRIDAKTTLGNEYPSDKKYINLILNEVGHYYYYDKYDGPTIAYYVWESTKVHDDFFNRLLEMDRVWVPSEWQKQCLIKQGFPKKKIDIVPEGVDVNKFYPIKNKQKKDKIQFLIAGRWDYRKSTTEIIETFLDTFKDKDDVELLLNVDNGYTPNGIPKSTEEKLKFYNLENDKIKILHFLPEKEYIETIRNADVFLSCARSEGWNLPLIESMASGVPSIYSECSGQLEFAQGMGHPVRIIDDAIADPKKTFNIGSLVGEYYEPDFDDLSKVLLDVYDNYDEYKNKALEDSKIIRDNYNWDTIANIAYNKITSFIEDIDQYYVTGGDQYFMPLLKTFVKSLKNFTNKKILVYGFNCDVDFDDDQIIKKRVNFEWSNKNGGDTSIYYGKIYAAMDAINEGYNKCVWIDGDVLFERNIEDIWNYSNDETYPLFMIYKSVLIHYRNGKSSRHGEEIANLLNIPIRNDIIVATGLFLFNNKCKEFFKEVLSYVDILKDADNINFIDDMALSEERLINAIFWKNNIKFKYLPITWISKDYDDLPILDKYKNVMLDGYDIMYDFTENGINNFPINGKNILFYHGQKDIEKNNDQFNKLYNVDKLLLVAHPDDESIFAGNLLLNERGWEVICLTNKQNKVRSLEFKKAMDFCNINDYYIFNYADTLNATFPDSTIDNIQHIVNNNNYKKILSHNDLGEYGHSLHISLNKILKQIKTNAEKYVFDDTGNIYDETYFYKNKLLSIYESQQTDLPGFNQYLKGESYKKMNYKKKILFVAPHLSTGGMPEVLRKRVEELKDVMDVYVVEFTYYGSVYVVQRNKILDMIGKDKFWTLGYLNETMDVHIKNRMKLLDIINDIDPDYVHMEEVPEKFDYNGFPDEVANEVYKKNRQYLIFETSHDSGFEPSKYKKYLPDKFIFISKWHLEKYNIFNVPMDVVEYPIEKKIRPNRNTSLEELNLDPSYKHILNVGLFTPRKNQAEIFEIAKLMEDEKVQFHFIGNQAGNFENYWKPLLENKPNNCVVWGERSDVDRFYSAMDLFIFTSQGHEYDRETNPIVLKEALSWDMPVLMYNLDVYCGKYENENLVSFLKENDMDSNINKIKNILKLNQESRLTSQSTEMIMPEKAFVLHTTKNYEATAEMCIKSLIEFSENNIILYTINYDSKLDYPNLIKIRFDVDNIPEPEFLTDYKGDKFVKRDNDGTYFTLTLKPKIMKHAIEKGLKLGVYLDSDMIANVNIDDIFNNEIELENYPLVSEGVYYKMGIDGKYNIETPLMEKLGVEFHNRTHYVQTNTILFNNNCLSFINEWKQLCEDESIISNWKEYAPYHEETIINVLLWKYEYNKRLPQTFMNVVDVDNIKDFYKCDVSNHYNDEHDRVIIDNDDGVDPTWLSFNKDKSKVYLFHGMKDANKMKNAINYLKDNSKNNNIAVVMFYDDKFEPGIISEKNIKKYCNKHGYNLKIYKEKLYDDDRPLQWNKIKVIQSEINNYDWIFWIDADCLIMNPDVKLESLIDDDYFMIIPYNKYAPDNELEQGGTALNSAFLIKNCNISKQFLNDVWNHDRYDGQKYNVNKFDHEMRQFRILINNDESYKKGIKLIEEKKLNSMWYMNYPNIITTHFPGWNNNDNIYEDGDFILHFAGFNIRDRYKLMNEFNAKVYPPKYDNINLQIKNKNEIGNLLNSLDLTGYGAEIGVLKGDMSRLILDKWRGELFMIDTWVHYDDYNDFNNPSTDEHIFNLNMAIKNTDTYNNRNNIIRMPSEKSVNLFPDSFFDFIYIDANHKYEYVKRDIEMWYPKLKIGGVFMCDDYIPTYDRHVWMTFSDGRDSIYAGEFGVTEAVDEFISEKNIKLYITTHELYWRQCYWIKEKE